MVSAEGQADRERELPGATKWTERIAAWTILAIAVVVAMIGLVWIVLHEILDAIDATTGLVASFSVGGVVLLVLAWVLVLDRLGVIDLDK